MRYDFLLYEDYAIFAGGMAVELLEQFPNSMKLATAELPEFIRIEGVVKHRFFTQDQAFLFQTGIDVVSVNVISYSSFKVFIDKIKTVLVSVQKLVSSQSITRLSIRYINKFSRTSQPFLSLNIKPPFSDTLKLNPLPAQLSQILLNQKALVICWYEFLHSDSTEIRQ